MTEREMPTSVKNNAISIASYFKLPNAASMKAISQCRTL